MKEKAATLFNALLAAVVGATLGIGPAFVVLVAACLAAAAFSKVRKETLAARGFADYIASFALVAMFASVLSG